MKEICFLFLYVFLKLCKKPLTVDGREDTSELREAVENHKPSDRSCKFFQYPPKFWCKCYPQKQAVVGAICEEVEY